MSKPLLPSEKEVLLWQDKSEKAILKTLEKHYNDALKDIDERITAMIGRMDASFPNVIRRIEYQRMLKEQIQTSLERLHSNEYEAVSQYLNDSYTDAFVGTMYTLHKQDVPIILPVDQSVAVKAVTIDSKLKESLYKSMGKDITKLKQNIAAEVTRGIATGLMYSDIARNLRSAAGIPLRRAKSIARTEAGRVQEQATFDAAKEAKAKGANVVKQWSAIRDGKTRDSHRKLDGQIREVDEPFEVNGKKAMHPHDFGVAELDINCRCTMLTRARAALDADDLKLMQERAAAHGLLVKDVKGFEEAKAKDFADFKKKYLKAAEIIGNAKKSDHPVTNRFGQIIVFDPKLEDEKWAESVNIIKELADEYDTRLIAVKTGAANAAGAVDMGGTMKLSSKKTEIAYHEFAHSIAIEALTKYGVANDSAFWKEIKSIKRAYRKDVGADTKRFISSYEHSANSVDEFMAEAFTQAKMIEKGLPLPDLYGKELTYSQKVLAIIDKYFKK